jgi:hypothetical protein
MTSLVTAGLYIWTGLEAAICTIQLLQHGRTFNLERVRLDECGDQFQRQRSRRLWMLYASVAGACSKCQRYQNPVNDEIRTPAHDVEKARDCQKEPLEVASSEGSDSQDQRCRSHTTGLRLVRNLAGMLLLYPVCMLVMSSYAASRGLLQDLGAFESSQVSYEFHQLSNDLLTYFRCKSIFYRNSYSGRLRWCSSLRASSGQCSSMYTTKAIPKTASRKQSWARRSFLDFCHALDTHRVRWAS